MEYSSPNLVIFHFSPPAPGFLQLLAPNGQPLRPWRSPHGTLATLEAAGLRDGAVLTALVKAPRLKATRRSRGFHGDFCGDGNPNR